MTQPTEDFYHEPVLLEDVIQLLIYGTERSSNKVYVDCTLGGGGYTKKILESTDESTIVLAMDYDSNSIRYCKRNLSNYQSRIIYYNDNFSNIKSVVKRAGYEKINGVVMDLGLSTYQLLSEEGFSYLRDTKLDMRADKSLKKTASEILNQYSQEQLTDLFHSYGELRYSKKIAREIVRNRKKKKIETTGELVEIMKQITPYRYLNRDLSKLFQSLRIEVNNELDNLRKALGDAVTVMESGARLVVVSYHSLEDRIVKNFFREAKDLTVITKKPRTASQYEISQNIKARSAKLRAAERI